MLSVVVLSVVVLSVVVLSVVVLSVVVLSVVVLSVVMLSVSMLSVITLCVIMLSVVKLCDIMHSVIIIVSKSPSETMDCPQTFIVKIIIIQNVHSCHIYMKWKEGASGQVSGETERERESEGARIAANRGGICCKNGC
jgi:hypothetical protein